MKGYVRYIIGVLFLIGAIILIVVGFNIIRGIFKPKVPDQQSQSSKVLNLTDVAKDGKAVRYVLQGPVSGNEEHHTIRITVDSGTRRVEILEGYSGQVTKSQEFPNTKEAYDAFMAALNGAGFTRTFDAKNRGSESQSCPLGRKFAYEVAPGTDTMFHSWNVSCGGKQGTAAGNTQVIQRLFERQIPDYNKYISGTPLI
jgi:hypothetical protein